MRYKIMDLEGVKAIQCTKCEFISFNQNDVERKYCSHCGIFHDCPCGGVILADTEQWKVPRCYYCYVALGEPSDEPEADEAWF